MATNLYATFFAAFAGALDRPFAQDAEGALLLSYGDLHAATGRMANLLRARGVQKGDRVAVQTGKAIEALVLYLATVRMGAVYLPLNPGYTLREVAYFLGDAEPALFVCDPARLEEARGLGVAEVETLASLSAAAAAQDAAFETVAVDAEDLAAILYTSGTTGRSKGAMLTHANLASNAETLRQVWRYTADDRLIHALPIFHTHGLFVATNLVLLTASRMTFLPAFDLEAIVRLLPSHTVLMGVPTFYSRLLSHDGLTRDQAADMRLFVSGSAPLSADTHRAFSERTGQAILERYGMTETNMNTSNPYDGARVPGSVGLPLPGVEVRIADADEEGIGMIEVRGPNVFRGYWRMPEKTAEEFRSDGFFVTGDLGSFDANGYLWISGRGKDLVISGGLNVYPAEVENLIDELPGVRESAVIGVAHPDLGEGVVAVVSADPGVTGEAISTALTDKLAAFKRPKKVVLVEELPRNAMGKIQKAALRETYAGLFSA